MDRNIDADYVENYGQENCLCLDYVFCRGVHFDDQALRENRKKLNGKYCYNSGYVAFVINNHYYISPNVERTLNVMNSAHMESSSDVYVPFGGLFEFPFQLGGDDLRRLQLSGYDPQTGKFDAASQVIRYYQTLINENITFRRWDRLCKEAGNQRNGKSIADQIMEYIVYPIHQHRDEYNAQVAEELELDLEGQKQGRNSR